MFASSHDELCCHQEELGYWYLKTSWNALARYQVRTWVSMVPGKNRGAKLSSEFSIAFPLRPLIIQNGTQKSMLIPECPLRSLLFPKWPPEVYINSKMVAKSLGSWADFLSRLLCCIEGIMDLKTYETEGGSCEYCCVQQGPEGLHSAYKAELEINYCV